MHTKDSDNYNLFSTDQSQAQALSPPSSPPPLMSAIITFTVYVKLHLMGAKFSDLKDNLTTPPIMTFQITSPANFKFWKSIEFYTFVKEVTDRFIPDTNIHKHLHCAGMAPSFEFVRMFYKNDYDEYEVFSNSNFAKDLIHFKQPNFVLDQSLNQEVFIFYDMKPMQRISSPFAISLAKMQKQCKCDTNCIHYFTGHPSPIHDKSIKTLLHFWFDGHI